jgi:hypothetical protein
MNSHPFKIDFSLKHIEQKDANILRLEESSQNVYLSFKGIGITILFIWAYTLLSSGRVIELLSQKLPQGIDRTLVVLIYWLVMAIALYVGLSFWKSPFPFKRVKVTTLDKNTNTLIEEVISYPFPLVRFKNGSFVYNQKTSIESSFKYDLSSINSIHEYTYDAGDEFIYFAALYFKKFDVYLPIFDTHTQKKAAQVISILCEFLGVDRGVNLNKKSISFTNPLLNLAVEKVTNNFSRKEPKSICIWSDKERVALSKAMQGS